MVWMANPPQFTSSFAFSAAVVLYVYTIQQRASDPDTCHSYFAAATQCQQHMFDLSKSGSLPSRYCLVLEELRIEALPRPQHQREGLAPLDGHDQSLVNSGVGSAVGIASITRGNIRRHFSFPDVNGTGDFDEFYVSLSSSLADMTGLAQFHSKVRQILTVSKQTLN